MAWLLFSFRQIIKLAAICEALLLPGFSLPVERAHENDSASGARRVSSIFFFFDN
jgi:hypothetical protein